ncbi:IQ calmodulin-binding motif-containing protein 1 [Liparis tanakae]|uniref:IQ calmodulin-binding motif-containing protein 1 n=1 Tax=Liparis tanakae TaxID=230148 RepID=A0A4Z2EMX8_9TELE|nr:IQ calmodulin-binding motif-containing protein 1 [Liparis tanakae]
MQRGSWDAAATLAQLTSQMIRRAEGLSLFRKVMDSVGWLLRSHTCLTTQVLSSVHYELIQMCDDVTVSLLCVQMWAESCTASRLILFMANQQELRVQPLLLSFRGLDSLLDKDWRGRGFDPDVDQLIALIQSDTRKFPQSSTERVRAACLIQAAWKSYQTRRRAKSLSRAVSTLQRRYRARRTRQRQQEEEQRWEEELKYQVRRFLQRRRAALAPPTSSFWIGQQGLTESRRAELRRQVEEHVAQHPSTRVSRQERERLHEEVQLLLLEELQRGGQRRREEQRVEALLAHTHTQLELLRDAPPLSIVTTTDVDSFLSPSGLVAARARDSHNAALQASRLPWWRLQETAGGVHTFSPAHLQELEAELGGLFVGGWGRSEGD